MRSVAVDPCPNRPRLGRKPSALTRARCWASTRIFIVTLNCEVHLRLPQLPQRGMRGDGQFRVTEDAVSLNHLPADHRSPQDLAPWESLSLAPGCPGVFGPVPQPVSMDAIGMQTGIEAVNRPGSALHRVRESRELPRWSRRRWGARRRSCGLSSSRRAHRNRWRGQD